AKQRLLEAYREYLLAVVKAVRASMIIVENQGVFVIPAEEHDGKELVVIADESLLEKHKNWYSRCYFFHVWEEAVNFYFNLFSPVWFRIDKNTLFDKKYWRITNRRVR